MERLWLRLFRVCRPGSLWTSPFWTANYGAANKVMAAADG